MLIAQIGFGNIGKKRVSALSEIPNVTLVSIVGPKNSDAARESGGFDKSIPYFGGIDKFLAADIDIDAVIISTPTIYSKKLCEIFLKRGVHVLVEKPPCHTHDELRYLIELAENNRLVFRVGYNLRFDDGIRYAKSLIDHKSLGDINYVKVTYCNGSALTNNNNVGSLLDIGVHSIDLALWLSDSFDIDFDSVQKVNQSIDFDGISNGFLSLRINSKKILVNIHHGFIHWKNEFDLYVGCEDGFVRVESLPKWGAQTVTLGKRLRPSGAPDLAFQNFDQENSWMNELISFVQDINFGRFDADRLYLPNFTICEF